MNLFVACVLVILASLLVVFVIVPILLACVASIVSYSKRLQNNDDNENKSSLFHSGLYIGRVWHTRYQPKYHHFTYPIFMFALDLIELEKFEKQLWPLYPWIIQFRPSIDHLKNKEGIMNTRTNTNASMTEVNSIVNRILRLVTEKTNDKYQPTLKTHQIILLTHLCYYGYNFNPVSFYYIISKETQQIDAIVGEVSNTPWTEMYCYVLHPDSIDQVQTMKREVSGVSKYDYSFPKAFHVSPFMEMDYWYDWSFIGIPNNYCGTTEYKNISQTSTTESNSITLLNSLRKQSNNQIAFTAKLIMDRHSVAPYRVVWQLIKFPIFCMIIQMWIHYQAVLLFIKGIVYIPHPQGSETTASKIIASIMIPFFAIRDYINPKNKTA